MEIRMPVSFIKQIDTAILLGDRWMAHRIWINDNFLLKRLAFYDIKRYGKIYDLINMAKESL